MADRPGRDRASPSDCPAGSAVGLAERAQARLRGHAYRALQGVACSYRDGVLTLRGRLPSYYLKQLAQEAVAALGVARVVNEIEVAGLPACSAAEWQDQAGAGRPGGPSG